MAHRERMALLAAALLAISVLAQAPADPGAKRQRLAYPVQSADAKALAETLSRHFKGEADVQVLAAPSGGHLLINASEKQMGEIVKLLGQLDRRPRAIAFEVIIAEVAPRKSENDPKLQESDLSGPARDVHKTIEALRKKGALSGLRRFQLAGVEDQSTSVMVGESKPFTTGGGGLPGRATSRVVNYRDVGTSVELKVRVAGKEFQVDLNLKDSRMVTPDDAPVLGKDENGVPIRPPQFTSSTFRGKLTVPAGRMVLAKGVEADSPAAKVQTVILVTARLVEPGGKGGE